MTLGKREGRFLPSFSCILALSPVSPAVLTQLSLTLAVLQIPLPLASFFLSLAASSSSVFPSGPAFLSHLSLHGFPQMLPSLCCSSSSLTSLISSSLSIRCFRSSALCITVFALRLDPAPTASALTPGAGTGAAVPPARCSRTFITFSDDATFEEWFPQGRPPKVPVREVCPVTHRPALYRDPVTDIPYATARAFKIIREAYKKYITAHGLPPAASALGPGPPPPEPLSSSGPRALRQKIVIK